MRRRAGLALNDLLGEVQKYVDATLEPGTAAIYKTTFNHFKQFAGNPPLRMLGPRDFDRYKACRLANVAPATVNIELRTLRAAFRMGVRWNLIRRDPFEGTSLVRIPERDLPFFTRGEFQRVIDAIPEQWLRAVVMFAATTGMRQGEILSLRWEQVDLRARTVRIGNNAIFRTKTGKRRVVPLSKAAMNVLQGLSSHAESDYVFTLCGRPLLRRWVTTKLRRKVRELGLDRRLNFKALRSSFASWLAIDGVSIYQISKLLGHSDVKITQGYYAHLEPGEMHDVVNRINFTCNEQKRRRYRAPLRPRESD